METQTLGLDNKELLHCVQCNQSYGYWQMGFFDTCLNCEEPLIFKEELK